MVRTIFFLIYFWIGMIFAVLSLLPYLLLQMFRLKKAAHSYIHSTCAFWCRHFMMIGGAKVEVSGLENIPDSDNLCLVSNHQSLADIAVIIGWLPIPVTFIAKKELFRVPLLGLWLMAMKVIPLNRRHGASAIEAISRGVSYIQNGQPVVIFPEGTRSRSSSIGRFKEGSMKLATRSKGVVLPLSVSNAYKLAEETGRVTPTLVHLHIHPPIDVKSLNDEQLRSLNTDIKTVIATKIIE